MADPLKTLTAADPLRDSRATRDGFIAHRVDHGVELLLPSSFADHPASARDTGEDPADASAAAADARLLRRLDDAGEADFGPGLDDTALQDGLRVLCRALAATLPPPDQSLLEAIVRR